MTTEILPHWDHGTRGGGPGDEQLLARFAGARDGDAFAALVERHGPMVFGVCRRLLRHTQDAEDAFQATFLVLARKAGALRRRELLAGWLYGVAHKVAGRLRGRTARLRERERQGVGVEPASPAVEAGAADLAAIHEEVGRLPAKYQRPIVLCHLQGYTCEEAARELGCPVGTVKGRLSRARDLLHGRLTRRGLAPAAGAVAAALAGDALAVPAVLAVSAVQAACAGDVSARAAALTQGVLKAMTVAKCKTAAVFVLALTVLAVGSAFLRSFAEGEPPVKKEAKADDRKTIQGTWKVKSMEAGGKEGKDAEADRIRSTVWEIAEDKITVSFKGEFRVAEYTLDAKATPARIDIRHTLPGKGIQEAILAIYRLEGDVLTICMPGPVAPGNEPVRPTKLKSVPADEEGKGETMLLVLVRDKK